MVHAVKQIPLIIVIVPLMNGPNHQIGVSQLQPVRNCIQKDWISTQCRIQNVAVFLQRVFQKRYMSSLSFKMIGSTPTVRRVIIQAPPVNFRQAFRSRASSGHNSGHDPRHACLGNLGGHAEIPHRFVSVRAVRHRHRMKFEWCDSKTRDSSAHFRVARSRPHIPPTVPPWQWPDRVGDWPPVASKRDGRRNTDG